MTTTLLLAGPSGPPFLIGAMEMMASNCRYPNLTVRISDLKGYSTVGAIERVTLRMRDGKVPPTVIGQFRMRIRVAENWEQVEKECSRWLDVT